MYIPIYVYQDEVLIKHFYESSTCLTPPDSILEILFHDPLPVSHTQTKVMNYYAIVKCNKNISLILGPVYAVSYSQQAIHDFFQLYHIPKLEQAEYNSHFQYIPPYSLDTFINHILLINFTLNGDKLTKLEYESKKMYGNVKNDIPETINLYQLEQLENDNPNLSYEMEKKIIPYIENGDLNGLMKMKTENLETNQRFGVFSNNPLQQRIIIFIIVQTLYSRAAIRGGLYQQTALSLMELYIRQAISMTSPSQIDDLLMQSTIDYTTRVQDEKILINIHSKIYKCLDYVRNNVSQPITAASVSDFSGYSRSHFSKLFKKELGFNISEFIVSCKLYEAQKLLKYSNRSIGDISNYLCFANQSHFQRLFKVKYGNTPAQYRKNNI